jgi:DNA (cytosine-5)-methyltransferase 3A
MWYDLGMRVLSLFDGISCARVALERAGHKVDAYFASEIDKYAIQISKKNYSDNNHIGSVVGLTMNESIDLLIGGSPCQDLSIAKKNRQGLDGARSGLFWEYVRILKEVKPKYFVLENVNSMPKEAKAIITEALGVEPIMINASLVSAQNRKRLFWTNIPNVTLPMDRGILLKDILEENVDEKYHISKDTKNKWIDKGLSKDGKAKAMSASQWKGIGNDGTTLVRIGQIGKGGQGDRIYSPEGKSVGLSALGGGRGAKTGLYAVARASVQKNAEQYSDGKTPALTSAMGMGGGNVPMLMDTETAEKLKGKYIGDERQVIRKLTPIECERLQGLPDNYTDGVSNTQRYKALGNAFNVDVVTHILSFIK